MKKRKTISAAESHPHLVTEWHPTKNGGWTLRDFSYGSDKKVWWKCAKNPEHEWISSINHRTIRSTQCHFCSGYKMSKSNCLLLLHPNLVKEWHVKNTFSPNQVSSSSNKKVWWKCPVADDHEWEAKICSRTNSNKTGCPCCAGLKAVSSNCLANTNPGIAAQWHPTKNGNLTPYMVTGSGRRVWWICSFGHEWEATINNRVSKYRGCPYCINRVIQKDTLRNFYVMEVYDKINDQKFLNIGITVYPLAIRYSGAQYKPFEFLPQLVINYKNDQIMQLEKAVKVRFKNDRFIPITKIGGFVKESFLLDAKLKILEYVESWRDFQ